MKKQTIAGVGAGAVLAVPVLAQVGVLPKTPEEAVSWTDAGVHFINTAGMPGIILVLLLALVGVVYYFEGVKYPAIHDRYTKKITDLEGTIDTLHGAALTYRDAVAAKFEERLEADADTRVKYTEATTNLGNTLNELSGRLKDLEQKGS